MKRILLISVALAFLSSPPPANALTVENAAVVETGGVSVERAHAEGSSEASVEVQSTIRTEGSNTRVRVDMRTEEDGVVRATTSGELQRGAGSLEVHVSSDGDQTVRASSTLDVSASSTPSRLLYALDRFRISLERIVRLVFFFW